MEYKDYYLVLGVNRDATQDEIKRSYRKLARKHHPDVSKEPGAEDRFKELTEAYEVLKDPEKRAAYDQLGANWQQGQDFRPPPDWDQGFEFHGGGFTQADPGHFSDFFENLFGRNFNRGAQRENQFRTKGANTHTRVAISLEDSYQGTTRSVNLKHSELGDDGRPHIKQRTLNIKIPKGIYTGQQIRLAGQGEPGIGGGEPGDLHLEVMFESNDLYHVDGKTVYVNLPIAPWEAALGGKIRTPTPSGAIDLQVPPNSRNGAKLRLKGRGIPAKQPGDLFVVLQIMLPTVSTDAEKEAFVRLQEAFDFNPRATLGV